VAWAAAHAGAKPAAVEIDATLHAERQERGRKRIHPLQYSPDELPDGSVVTFEGHAYTLADGLAFRWRESGYLPAVELERADGLLTPPSTVLALRSGYRPVLHPDLIEGKRQNLHAR
jgi:hypothetical protein